MPPYRTTTLYNSGARLPDRDCKNNKKGMNVRDAAGNQFTGYGRCAALSFDEGQTWPVRGLVTRVREK